jgi:hypothetical protein
MYKSCRLEPNNLNHYKKLRFINLSLVVAKILGNNNRGIPV